MFLRFDEVRSSGEKQHDVLLCLCRGLVVGSLWCGLREEAEGAGGQGEQRGGRNFLEEQRIISPPITFCLCLHSQHYLVSYYSLRALMKPPINHLLPTYFSDLADLSHHISPIYSTSLLITSLIPLPISQLPQKQK